MHVQVRIGIAVDLVVHLRRCQQLGDALGDRHAAEPEAHLRVFIELVGLNDMRFGYHAHVAR